MIIIELITTLVHNGTFVSFRHKEKRDNFSWIKNYGFINITSSAEGNWHLTTALNSTPLVRAPILT